jgi:hypothetical protein
MCKIDTMVSYLTRIIELKDQLVDIGTKVEDQELVSISLNGLAISWMPFVQGVLVCPLTLYLVLDGMWTVELQDI